MGWDYDNKLSAMEISILGVGVRAQSVLESDCDAPRRNQDGMCNQGDQVEWTWQR